MIELYKNYFYIFLHPIKSLNFSTKKDVVPEYPGANPFTLVQDHADGCEITLKEVILLSWPFYFITVCYQFAYNTFFHVYLKNYSVENSLISEITSSFKTYFVIYDNYSLLFKFVFFPFMLLFYLKIWQFIISLTLEIIAPNTKKEDTEQIVLHSFVSHLFLAIPIFGPILTFIAHIIFIFLGVRHNLRLGRAQAILIISTPLILSLLILTIIITMYSLIFMLA